MKKILVAYLLLASCLFTAYANPAERLERRGLTFTENKGQVVDVEGNARPDVKFTSEKNGVSVYFRSDAISYVFPQVKQTEEGPVVTGLYRSDVEFLGANPDVQLVAENKAAGFTNFMTTAGNFSDVASYQKLVYQNLYDNIDLVFYPAGQKNGQLKYEFVVRPGADVSAIRMKHNGATSLRVDGGRLVSENTVGSLVEEAPFTFQTRNGKQVEVASKYSVKNGVVTFEVGDYNAKNTLVIDPLTRLWATNIGGSRLERGSDVAFDNAGNSIIAGFTASSDFPATVGLTAFQGQNDIIVAKFDANGNRLWALYYGGSGTDQAYGVAVDGNNNINVGGYTTSVGLSGASNSYAGSGDGIIMQLDANANVNWTRYYGGTSNDRVESIDVWANGDVAVAGRTLSSLPNATGAAPAQLNGFAGRFSGVDGSTTWVNYAGGSGFDEAKAIAVDNNNNVFVAGYSASADFPVTIGSGAANNRDGFVAKYNANGAALWAQLIGGSQNDFLLGATTDANGNVFVVGYTNSADFPTQLAFQNALNGTTDATLTAYDANGGQIMSTYAGGSEREQAFDVARAGNFVYVAGNTNSGNFPSIDAANSNLSANQGANNVFTLRLNLNNLTTSQSSILYGGEGDDVATGVDAMSNGMIVLTGYSNSGDYPRTLTANNAPGLGNDDAIVIKYQDPEVNDGCPALTVATTNNSPYCGMNAGMITVTAPTGSNFQYSLNGGANQTSNMFSGLTDGTYTVTVTNTNDNCTYNSAAVSLTMSPAISVNVSDVTIDCGASNGMLSANVSGGVAPFTYNWSNGSNDQTAMNLMEGAYTVTVTDNNNCTQVATGNVNTVSNLSINILTNPVTCSSVTGSITATVIGATNPVTYTLTGPATATNNDGNFTALAAGTYTVTAVEAVTNCSATATAVVQNLAQFPVAGATGINGNCVNNTPARIIFTPSGGSGQYDYSINNGQDYFNQPLFDNLQPGTYNAVVRDRSTGCVSATQVVTINNGGGVVLSAVSVLNQPECGRDDGKLDVMFSGGSAPYVVTYTIPGDSRSFGPINMAGSFEIAGLEAGEYTVTVQDGNGCTASRTVVLENKPTSVPSISIVDASPGCFDEETPSGSITVEVDALSSSIRPVHYFKLDDGPYIPSVDRYTFENLTDGTYRVYIATTLTGECEVFQDVTLTAPAAIQIPAVAKTDANCTTGTGRIDVIALGGTPDLMYSIGDGFQASSTFMNVPANSDGYTITVMDANGCTAVYRETVVINNASGLALDNAGVTFTRPSCDANTGDVTVDLMGTGSPAYIYYIDGVVDRGPTASDMHTYQNVSPGAHTLRIEDNAGCYVEKDITFGPLSISTSVLNPTCEVVNNAYRANGKVTVTVNNGSGTYDYAIYGNTLSYATRTYAAYARQTHPAVTASTYEYPEELGPGVYVIEVTDYSTTPCILRDTITIGHDGQPTLEAYFVPECNAGGNTPNDHIRVEYGSTAVAGRWSIIGYGANASHAAPTGAATGNQTVMMIDWDSNNNNLTNGADITTGMYYNAFITNTGNRCVSYANPVNVPVFVSQVNTDVIRMDDVVVTQPDCNTLANGSIKIVAQTDLGWVELEYALGANDPNAANALWYPRRVTSAANPNDGLPTDYTDDDWEFDPTYTGLPAGATFAASNIRVRPRGTVSVSPAGCEVNFNSFDGPGNSPININTPTLTIETPPSGTVDETCNGNGQIRVNVTSTPNAPYEYRLSNAGLYPTKPVVEEVTGVTATTYLFDNLEGSISPYTIRVTDANGCTATEVINIADNSLGIQDIVGVGGNATPTLPTGCADGAFNINLRNGINNRQYQVSINGGGSYTNLIYNTGLAPDRFNGGGFTGLPAGTYNVIVKDPVTGCEARTTYTLATNAANTAEYEIRSVSFTNPSCPGGTDGSITFSVFFKDAHPVPPAPAGIAGVAIDGDPAGIDVATEVSYSRSTGVLTYTRSNLAAGDYRLWVQEPSCNGGAPYQIPFHIVTLESANPVRITSVTTTDESSCGANDGTLTINTSGGSGSANLRYSINGYSGPFQTANNVFTGLTPGLYMGENIVVVDNNGCATDNRDDFGPATGTPNDDANIIAASTLSFVAATTMGVDPNCTNPNSGQITIETINGTPNFILSVREETIGFIRPDEVFTTNVSRTIAGLSSGTYIVTVSEMGGDMCSIETRIELDGGEIPPATFTAFNPSTCGNNDGQIVYNFDSKLQVPAGGNAVYQYRFISNGTQFVGWTDIVDINSVTFNTLTSGVYMLEIREKGTAACATPTTVYLVDNANIAAFPNVTPIAPSNFGCNNGFILITPPTTIGSGAQNIRYQYSMDNGVTWTPGLNSGTASLNFFNSLTAGRYYLRIASNVPGESNVCYTYRNDPIDLVCSSRLATTMDDAAAALTVYPNPTRDNVTVKMNATAEGSALINVTDVTGRTVSTQNFETVLGLNEVSVDMNELTSGVYFLQVVSADGVQTVKVVKQ